MCPGVYTATGSVLSDWMVCAVRGYYRLRLEENILELTHSHDVTLLSSPVHFISLSIPTQNVRALKQETFELEDRISFFLTRQFRNSFAVMGQLMT